MKVGDKLMCYNTYYGEYITFNRGIAYKVTLVTDDYVTIRTTYSDMIFYTNKDLELAYTKDVYLLDYFDTPESLRLKKLKSL